MFPTKYSFQSFDQHWHITALKSPVCIRVHSSLYILWAWRNFHCTPKCLWCPEALAYSIDVTLLHCIVYSESCRTFTLTILLSISSSSAQGRFSTCSVFTTHSVSNVILVDVRQCLCNCDLQTPVVRSIFSCPNSLRVCPITYSVPLVLLVLLNVILSCK